MADGVGEGGENLHKFLSAVWEKCVTVEEGQKPNLDDMPLSTLNEIVDLASGKADFQKPSRP